MGASSTPIIFLHLFCLSLLLICNVTAAESDSENVNCIPSEREALLSLKYHLNDTSNRLSSWNATSNPNCCLWLGVVCSYLTSHVLRLHLNTPQPLPGDFATSFEYYEAYDAYERSMLRGEIDHSLVELKHLSYLDLSGNGFGGMQIPTFLCEITSFTYLNLSHAGFYGEIPHQIGNLSNLLYLDLSYAANGTIPYQIGNLTKLLHLGLQSGNNLQVVADNLNWLSDLTSLQYLDMSSTDLSKSVDWLQVMQSLPSLMELHLLGCTFGDYNQPSTLNFSSLSSLSISITPRWIFGLTKLVSLQFGFLSEIAGPIPSGIQNLTMLQNLDLSRNSFTSSIPQWLYDLLHLKFLNLGYNELGGPISNLLGNLNYLVNLDLSYNNFESVVPNSLGDLIFLVSLDLSYNKIEGIVPISLRNLTSLVRLDLSHNEFEDVVSISLGDLTSLVSLDLSHNKLKGLIPISLGNLASLVRLDLSHNEFEDVIPISLGDLTSLVSFDLSHNKLKGLIPISLGNLASLVKLDLSANKFEGAVPISLGNLTSLVTLDISDNQLEGKIIPNSLRNLCNLKKISFSKLKCNQQVSEILEIFTPCVSQKLKILQASSAQISGHLTDQVGMFKNLVILDFSNNSITGTISQLLGEHLSLEELYLSSNKLEGRPFKILGSIPKLTKLNLDENLFQGVVEEDDLANFTNLNEFFASRNNLTLKVDPNWQPSFQLQYLAMASWQLGPSFPSWIQSQKNLVYLDVSNTGISDSIPSWFLKNFSYVYYLNLSHNHINGELPKTLEFMELVDLRSNCLNGKLPYFPVGLRWLDLSQNSFSGSMTDFLCQRREGERWLQYFNLASNNLSGKIPDCWKLWSYLVDVNLESNYLSGILPSSLGSLSQLQSLHIGNNQLSGKFPLTLRNTTKLILLDLGQNNLTGKIPTWVGESLINLKIFRLRSNKFSDNIPIEICDMKLLQVLDLAQNNLYGNIPKCLNHLSAMVISKNSTSSIYVEDTSLLYPTSVSVVLWVKGDGIEYRNILGLVKSIDLSDNKLSGEIPGEITNLLGLIYLNLSNNQLTGHIPQCIGNMRSLESIDFSRNQLSGEIPPTITNLSFLSKLDLSYNHLKGEIPTCTQLQTFEASGFIGNDLCGLPLPVNCSLGGKVRDADHNDRKHKKHGVNWFFVSMGFGFIVGFWGVVLPLFICRSWRYAYYRFLDNMWYKLQSFW